MIFTGFDGRLTRNPEQGQTQQGTQYVTLTVATDSSRRNAQGNYATTFVRVTVWGNRGNFVLDHFMKGDPIFVAGELTMNSYQNHDGQERQSLEMTASNVSFVPQIPERNRTPRPQNNQGMQNGSQQAPQRNYNQPMDNQSQQQQNAPQSPQNQNNGYQQPAPQNQNSGYQQPVNNGQGNQQSQPYNQQNLDNLEDQMPF